MNIFIVHIGLSKTATTSLQADFFGKFDGVLFEYVGVEQPRVNEQDGLYEKIMNYVRGCCEPGFKDDIRAELEGRLDCASLPVLMSEEMLTVNSGGCDWKDKLTRLSEMISRVDYLILVTVREPVEAMFSYYLERYNVLRYNFNDFQSFVDCSADAKIFRYGMFCEYLSKIFKSDTVRYIQYEKIKDSNEYVLSVADALNIDIHTDVVLGQHNVRKQNESGFFVERRMLSDLIAKFIRMSPFKRVLGNSVIKKLLLPFYSFAKSVPIQFSSSIVPHLKQDEKKYCHQKLAKSNEAFKALTGIDYT